jgi:hypothetical protein
MISIWVIREQTTDNQFFHTSLRLAFGSHSCAPQPNHNFHQVQAGSIHGACVSCEEAARKYLRRAYRSTLRPVITVCVRKIRKDIHIPVVMAGVYDSGVVPLLLLFVIFAVRAPNWICKISALTSLQARKSYVRLASSRTRPWTCPTARQDI